MKTYRLKTKGKPIVTLIQEFHTKKSAREFATWNVKIHPWVNWEDIYEIIVAKPIQGKDIKYGRRIWRQNLERFF